MVNNIVLDTNCLIASLSKRGNYFQVWKDLHAGKYILCVSNEILAEYEEVIALKTTPRIATNVIQALLNSPFVRLVDTYFRFNLIQSDVDDNKFVDCAIAANAVFIVSEDAHFNVLKEIAFPCVNVIRLERFLQILKNQYYSITDTPTSFLNEETIGYGKAQE